MPIVTIGPNTTDDFTGLEDSYMMSLEPTTVKDDLGDIGISKFATGDHAHGFFRFTGLSNLPSGIAVSEARLYASVLFNNTPAGYTVTAYRILRNVVFSQATWNIYSTGNNWQTAGAEGALDRNATPLATYVFAGTEVGDTRFYLTGSGLASAIQDLANGVISDLVLLLERTDGEDDETYLAVYAADEPGVDGSYPSLYVNYEMASAGIEADMAVTEGADTVAADVDVRIAATLSVTEGADTVAADVDMVVTATLTVTEGADTVAGDVDVRIAAALAVTEGADTVAGDVDVRIAATLSVTEGADTAAADADVYVAASLAVTEGADTAAVSAQLLSYIVVLTSIEEVADDRITAIPDLEAGWWLEIGPTVTGGTILDVNVNPDATFDTDEAVTSFEVRAWNGLTWGAYATQDVEGEELSVELIVTEGADTVAGDVDVFVAATLAVTEGADTVAADVDVRIAAALSVTEGADTVAADADVVVAAALSATEGADTVAADVDVYVTATLAATEGSDTILANAGSGVIALMNVTEGEDTVAADVDVYVTASLAVTEAADTVSADADSGEFIQVSVAVTEEADTAEADVDVYIAASLAATEGADTLAADSNVFIQALMDVTEGSDTFFGTTLPLQDVTVIVPLQGSYSSRIALTGSK